MLATISRTKRGVVLFAPCFGELAAESTSALTGITSVTDPNLTREARTMDFLAKIVYWEMIFLLGGISVIVLWKLLTGGISLNLLLYGDTSDGQTSFSPGRLQLLMITLLVALRFVLEVMRDPSTFPHIPNTWLVALGGSHVVYLGAKAQALLSGRR
jgi:hypothetical protein